MDGGISSSDISHTLKLGALELVWPWNSAIHVNERIIRGVGASIKKIHTVVRNKMCTNR